LPLDIPPERRPVSFGTVQERLPRSPKQPHARHPSKVPHTAETASDPTAHLRTARDS